VRKVSGKAQTPFRAEFFRVQGGESFLFSFDSMASGTFQESGYQSRFLEKYLTITR
jgi:hypothetical protein